MSWLEFEKKSALARATSSDNSRKFFIFDDSAFDLDTLIYNNDYWHITHRSLLFGLFDTNWLVFVKRNKDYFEDGKHKGKIEKYQQFHEKYKHWRNNLAISVIDTIKEFINTGCLYESLNFAHN